MHRWNLSRRTHVRCFHWAITLHKSCQPTRTLPIGQATRQMLTFLITWAKNVREQLSSQCRPTRNTADHNSPCVPATKPVFEIAAS
jgi:hypothetical protein